MKKIYSILLGAAFVASSSIVSAQQLPNGDFENWKGSCGTSEAFTKQSSKMVSEFRQRPGDEPADWNGSSVNQLAGTVSATGTLISQVNGVEGSCVQMKNVKVGVKIFTMVIGAPAPGFITFGTPWVYAITDVAKCDGGTYGGVAFSNTPDAITGQYKRTDSNNEESHIIAYLWNGTFKSCVGQKDAPYSEWVREDVDRTILGKNDADVYSVSGDGKLVASCDYTFTTTNSDWQTITVPLTYDEKAGAPTKMNVIVSGGDYWTRGNVTENTTLLADNVRFAYYSRLNDIKVGGVSVDGFASDVYSYKMSGTTLPDESEIEVSLMGRSAQYSVAVDADAATITISVTNDGEDVDNVAEHTYVLQYEKEQVDDNASIQYEGKLVIDMMGAVLTPDGGQDAKVYITPKTSTTCDFKLPDFTLDLSTIGLGDVLNLGDIYLTGVSITKNSDGTTSYSGYAQNMLLAEGTLSADVVLSGTVDGDSNAVMDIDVIWHSEDSGDIPIDVTFNGSESTSVIDGIYTAPSNSVPEYYNLQGVKVSNPENGVFIRVQGGKATKVVK